MLKTPLLAQSVMSRHPRQLFRTRMLPSASPRQSRIIPLLVASRPTRRSESVISNMLKRTWIPMVSLVCFARICARRSLHSDILDETGSHVYARIVWLSGRRLAFYFQVPSSEQQDVAPFGVSPTFVQLPASPFIFVSRLDHRIASSLLGPGIIES